MIRLLLEGSQRIDSRAKEGRRNMDPDPLRCLPQYLGVARDATANAEQYVKVELNSAENGPWSEDSR